MSEQWESIKAVTFDDLVSMLGIESMGYQKYEVVKHLIGESLRPYRIRSGLGHSSKECEAELISRSLLYAVGLRYYNEKGQDVGYTGRYHLDSCNFSFSGIEVQTKELVFKLSDVEAFFESRGLLSKGASMGDSTKNHDVPQSVERKVENLDQSWPSKTAAASEALDRSTAERWSGYLSTAVKMVTEIMNTDPQEYTKAQLVKLAKKHGGVWKGDGAPMTAFRKALPDEYKNQGGAPKQ